MFRNEKGTRVQEWILKTTRIGPVMDIKVCRHDMLEIHPCTHILLCSQVFQSWLAVASSDHILLCLAQVTEKKKGIIATT